MKLCNYIKHRVIKNGKLNSLVSLICFLFFNVKLNLKTTSGNDEITIALTGCPIEERKNSTFFQH